MRVVRRGIFETNSSSTHAIVWARSNRGEYRTPPESNLRPDENNVLYVETDEFGWGPEKYDDARSKASYCLTWIRSVTGYGKPSSKVEEIMLTEVLKMGTGAEKVVLGPLNSGYIDHQSIERDHLFVSGQESIPLPSWGAASEAFITPSRLFSFIFDPQVQLVIDHDNH